jgi:hypothetical protein
MRIVVSDEQSDSTLHRGRRLTAMTLAAVIATGLVARTAHPAAAAQATTAVTWQTYQDSKGRFSFDYPSTFGTAPPSTDDSGGGRLAVYFRDINTEAVLTTGAVQFGRSLLGGLYDDVALQGVTPGDQAALKRERPAVTVDNFCSVMKASDTPTWIDTLDDRLHAEAGMINGLNDADPQVRLCEGTGTVRHFIKDVATSSEDLRRHIYGSVNFLTGTYSSFQIIRVAATAPDPSKLADLDRMVGSIKVTGK